ncbi:MAG TPA: hypothetical protein VHD36_03405 [Pirellulales bacterium]|nr:hypothetical protein [Pirellulales bacterium]
MPENFGQSDRAAALIAQDPDIHESRLKEMRMQLEQSLAKWERDGRIVRRAAWIATIVLLLDYLAVIPLAWAGKFSGQQVAMFAWSAVGCISLLLALYFTILHRAKYARRIAQGRFDLQMSMLREPAQQVDELRRQIHRRPE